MKRTPQTHDAPRQTRIAIIELSGEHLAHVIGGDDTDGYSKDDPAPTPDGDAWAG